MHPGIYESVLEWIPEGARVLDLGTGDGAFLERLVRARRVMAEGVERDPDLVARCIQRAKKRIMRFQPFFQYVLLTA